MKNESEFERCANTLQLSAEGKKLAWERMGMLRMGDGEPEVVRLMVGIWLDERLGGFKDYNEELLGHAEYVIVESVGRATERVADTANRVEKASNAKLNATSAELVAKLGERIAQIADRALAKKVAVHSRNTLASWLLSAVVASGLVGVASYQFGKRNVEANITQVSGMLTREDGSAWASMMSVNDMSGTLANHCRVGSPNVRRVDGGVVCSMPLWISHDGVVASVPGYAMGGNAVLASVGAWLASWGPWALLGAGAIGLLLVRKLARVLKAWEPIRWLLDLPAPPADAEVQA